MNLAVASLILFGLLLSFRIFTWEWPLFQAVMMSLFAVALIRNKLRWSRFYLPWIAICAWPAAQLVTGTTVYPNATLLELLRWTLYAAVFVLGFCLYQDRHEISQLMRIFIVFSLVLAAEATLQHFAGNGKVFWLFEATQPAGSEMGPFFNRDHYASLMALILPMAILRAFDEPHRRMTYILAAAGMYASVVAGASRAGSLLVTAEVLICLVLVKRNRASIAVPLLIAALVAVVGWEPLLKRFQDDDPYKGRREFAQSSIQMIRDQPLHGFGLGTWTTVYPRYATFDPGAYVNAAHNDWLQWAADGGIPFAGLFFVLFVISLVVAWRVPWALGIPAVFIHCTVDFPVQGGRYIPVVMFLIFGVAVRRAMARKGAETRSPMSMEPTASR